MQESTHPQTFTKTVTIHASPAAVWAALTDTSLMKQWMSEAITGITTTWQPGSPFVISGQLYKKPFENTGTVLTFVPQHELAYTHLSSLSRLPGVAEDHCTLRFQLAEQEEGTDLSLTITSFPTAAIYHHLAFYWNVTLELLKKFVEGQL